MNKEFLLNKIPWLWLAVAVLSLAILVQNYHTSSIMGVQQEQRRDSSTQPVDPCPPGKPITTPYQCDPIFSKTITIEKGSHMGDFIVKDIRVSNPRNNFHTYHIDTVGTTTISGMAWSGNPYDEEVWTYCFYVDKDDAERIPHLPNDHESTNGFCFRNPNTLPSELKKQNTDFKPYWKGEIMIANYETVYAPENTSWADFVKIVR